MSEPARHVVVVTLGGCDPREDHPGEPHDTDCYERTLECPRVTPACQLWMQCQHVDCLGKDVDGDVAEDDEVRHGVPHEFMRHDGCWWGVQRPGACYFQWSDSTCDAISELELKEPGRYPVECETDDIYPVLRLAEEGAR